MLNYSQSITDILKNVNKVALNPSRKLMIHDAVSRNYCMALPTGTLATWTPDHSTGRSPKDTYIVQNPESTATIDWTSPNCIPLPSETFDMIFSDAIQTLKQKDRLFALNRVIGADAAYCLPVLTVTDNPLSALFCDNMFRPVPENSQDSIFAEKPFFLLSLPYDYLDSNRYADKLRHLPNGDTSPLCVVMDYDKRIGIVYGSAYMGSMKKLIFTVMNYYLPEKNILPLHCSANEGPDGNSALLLGLSGTGKTTLSADPERALLGDDEHGWNDTGIANFEYGCYAKLINLNPQKEPDIFQATFHHAHYLEHGSIVENLMVYPDGKFDLNDDRFTQNSRASYPLVYNSNVKPSACSGHPKTILFLTADAYGVLPPLAKLTPDQAMFWFIMGYTSKLAGTETGITDPQATFSRFFGAPFMPRNPSDYADLLGKKMQVHEAQVFSINTGWSGGPHGIGARIDLNLTRAMVRAAFNGELDNITLQPDPIFKILVPEKCPGVPSEILNPINTWADKDAFHEQADKLAGQFISHFEKSFKGKVRPEIAAACPKMK